MKSPRKLRTRNLSDVDRFFDADSDDEMFQDKATDSVGQTVVASGSAAPSVRTESNSNGTSALHFICAT